MSTCTNNVIFINLLLINVDGARDRLVSFVIRATITSRTTNERERGGGGVKMRSIIIIMYVAIGCVVRLAGDHRSTQKKCDVNCVEIGFYLLLHMCVCLRLAAIVRVLLTYCWLRSILNSVTIFYRQLLLLSWDSSIDRCQLGPSNACNGLRDANDENHRRRDMGIGIRFTCVHWMVKRVLACARTKWYFAEYWWPFLEITGNWRQTQKRRIYFWHWPRSTILLRSIRIACDIFATRKRAHTERMKIRCNWSKRERRMSDWLVGGSDREMVAFDWANTRSGRRLIGTINCHLLTSLGLECPILQWLGLPYIWSISSGQ